MIDEGGIGMNKPFRYYGGKGKLLPELLRLIPEHETYVEVFAGSATLLFNKSPSLLEVVNDLDSDIVNVFRILRDEKAFETFIEKIALTPYSREEYEYSLEILDTLAPGSVDRAYRWFILASMCMSGMIKSGWSHNVIPNGAYCKVWAKMPENLQKFHYRLRKVQIEHRDFRKLIPIYDRETTFMYLDPPYIPNTRVAKDVYDKEMTEAEHKELVDLIINSKSKFLLSGYDHPIYSLLVENGWNRNDFEVSCGVSVGRKRTKRTEIVWSNCVPEEKRIFKIKLEGPEVIVREESGPYGFMTDAGDQLLLQIFGFRLPEWRKFLMSRTKNH
jgi:DNA adenine methylase